MIQYLDRRVAFYTTRDQGQIDSIDAETAKLQNEMWSIVQDAAKSQPTPITALAVAGMNDVLNRQGYTQAAWWNRIPRRCMEPDGDSRHLLLPAHRLQRRTTREHCSL